jgi:hypothetical protein
VASEAQEVAAELADVGGKVRDELRGVDEHDRAGRVAGVGDATHRR